MVKRAKAASTANTTPATLVPKPDETPRDKFERLLVSRMNRVLNAIRLLGNLASPAYDYHEQDVHQVHQAVTLQLAESLDRFKRHKRGEKPVFILEPIDERERTG